LLALPVAVVLIVAAFIFVAPLRRLLGAVGVRANSMYKLIMTGVILGTVGALIMSFIFAVALKSNTAPAVAAVNPQNQAVVPANPQNPALAPVNPQNQAAAPATSLMQTILGYDAGTATRFIEWTTIAVVLLALALIVPALIKF